MFDYDADKGQIRMYGVIGEYEDEISATDFMAALDAMEGQDVHILLKSPGGEIDDGLSIYNQIEAYEGKVTVEIDAQAASIATVFPMAADRVIIRKRAEMFIHDPWTIAMGNSVTFRGVADWLDALGREIAGVYADRAGGSADEWFDRMREETRYNSEEAVAVGLADEVISGRKTHKKADNRVVPVASLKVACMANALDKRRRISKR